MTNQFKDHLQAAANMAQNGAEALQDKAQDFLEQQKIPSADEIKQSLGKTAQGLESASPPCLASFCDQVKTRPLSAVLLSLVTGFILGRISK
ncbi:hypothetical protein PT277_01265 [Acetobacteraceae bacterium ESL0709]|nr:hypothetical protein [Acetobacteraceae bacterium ESL0697]MDF7677331.1 hypothetical protein [Acetobacteraceae bacterium ESL0709]